jgi:hypothetical protein
MTLIASSTFFFTFVLAIVAGGTGSGATYLRTREQRSLSAVKVDEDGVTMLHPTKNKGLIWRLGDRNPNNITFFKANGNAVTSKSEGNLKYWNLEAIPVTYTGNESGWTTRFDVYNSNTKKQLYSWKSQKGYLGSVKDPRDEEVTIYMRGHGAVSMKRLQWTLKIRGGEHTNVNPERASCTMMTFGVKNTTRITKFGKELTHPYYDYVSLKPKIPDTELKENVWYGLKLVSYRKNAWSTHNQLWLDTDPWDANGKPKNNWRLFSEYVDATGKSTGRYNQTADWGGLITMVRTDGWHNVDFALFSVREIHHSD